MQRGVAAEHPRGGGSTPSSRSTTPGKRLLEPAKAAGKASSLATNARALPLITRAELTVIRAMMPGLYHAGQVMACSAAGTEEMIRRLKQAKHSATKSSNRTINYIVIKHVVDQLYRRSAMSSVNHIGDQQY